MNVISLPDPDTLAQYAASYVADIVRDRQYTNVALSGGSTPRAMHGYLRQLELAWETLDLWLGDERWVPPTDAESNARMARDTLTDFVGARLHEVPFGADPVVAADAYSSTLSNLFDTPDLVLLGIGDDGHTASLFPGSPALAMGGTYVAHFVQAKDIYRLTATFDLLASAKKIVFLVSGEGKLAALTELLEGSEAPLPARRVAENGSDVTWLVDDAASAGLATTAVDRP